MAEPKVHLVRFVEQDGWVPARYRKEHEVTQGDSVADVMVAYTDTIFLHKHDIEFLMESEA